MTTPEIIQLEKELNFISRLVKFVEPLKPKDYDCCPNCGGDLIAHSMNGFEDYECNFCPNCGQAIDWSN